MKVCPFCQQDIVWHARLKSDLNYNFLMCFECDSVWLADQPVSDQAGTTFEAHMKAGARAPDWADIEKREPIE